MGGTYKVYLRLIYLGLLFLTYYLGNTLYGTPFNSTHTYTIFLTLCLYYYFIDLLDFIHPRRFKTWTLSFLGNLFLALFLWSFSKSDVLLFKFLLFWVGSNLLREGLLLIRRPSSKGLFVGEEKKFHKTVKERCSQLHFIKRIDGDTPGEKILQIIQEEDIELVVIEEEVVNKHLDEFLRLKLQGVILYFPWQYKEIVECKIDVTNISQRWFLYSQGFTILTDTFEKKLKRTLDILGAILVGVLALPIIALVIPMLTLSGLLSPRTKGPFFFRQVRVGLGGKPFKIIKFRTMINKEHWSAVGFDPAQDSWTEKNDPRVTPLGRFMRKTRIDELPQLINVLRGEMSFIGPRPESISYVQQLEKEIPFYSLRHTVLPGLSGWAQVMYPYGASVEDSLHKLEYDLYYIKYQNFPTDVLILLKTLKVLFFGRGR